MITGYVGFPGAGKTYSAVVEVSERFRSGWPQVFSNMKGLSLPECVYVEDLESFTAVSQGLMVFDEAGVWLSSRYWQQVSRDVLMALAQVRKNGLNLIWTAQHESRVDTVLRELTSELVRCRRIGKWVLQNVVDPVAGVSIRRRVVRLEPKNFALYDTLEIIKASVTAGDKQFEEGSAWLAAARSRRAAAASRRRQAGRRNRRAEGRRLYWHLDRCAVMKAEVSEVVAYLRENGLLLPGDDVRKNIISELERRAWLARFGLTVDDVPVSCTPTRPHAAGYSPIEVEQRRLLRELADAESAVVQAKKRLRAS